MRKKLFVTIVICSVFVLVGCGNKETTNNYEETMKEYATEFYNAHLKGTEGLKTTEISIAKLKDAVTKVGDTYDMSKLDKCKDTSYVELQINEEDNSVSKYTFHMECE